MLTIVTHVHSLSGVDQEEVARRCEAEESRVAVDPDVGAARIQQLVRQVSTLTCGTAAALWATATAALTVAHLNATHDSSHSAIHRGQTYKCEPTQCG